jgi:hypothetical protein
MTDEMFEIEVFCLSNSFRWADLAKCQKAAENQISLPRPKRLLQLAENFLLKHGWNDRFAKFHNFGQTTITFYDERQHCELNFPLMKTVNYRFSLHSFPVFGPGAKMSVTIGESGVYVSAYKFWRESVAEEAVPIISIKAAAELLRRSLSFAKLNPRE